MNKLSNLYSEMQLPSNIRKGSIKHPIMFHSARVNKKNHNVVKNIIAFLPLESFKFVLLQCYENYHQNEHGKQYNDDTSNQKAANFTSSNMMWRGTG